MTREAVRSKAMLVRLDTREEIVIDRLQITIGRAAENDLVIKHLPLVSRHHARLFEYAGGMYLEDLNSSNGTFVNGHRIDRPVYLEEFDRICIGGFVCDYIVAGEEVPDPGTVTGTVSGAVVEFVQAAS